MRCSMIASNSDSPGCASAVLRAFLRGYGQLTGQSDDHRRHRIENRILALAECFNVSVYAYVDKIRRLSESGIARVLDPGQLFICQGQVPEKFAFVGSGLFRYVYTDRKGKESTKAFMPETRFISSYSAMLQYSASHFQIEALEQSEILEFFYMFSPFSAYSAAYTAT